MDHDQLMMRLRMKLDDEIDALRGALPDTGGPAPEALSKYNHFRRLLLEFMTWSDSKLALMVERPGILADLTDYEAKLDYAAAHLHEHDYESAVLLYVAGRYYDARFEKLTARLRADQEAYLSGLREQGMDAVIENAGGIALRQRIMACFDKPGLAIQDVDILLAAEHPLEEICNHYFAEENSVAQECISWTLGTLLDHLLYKDFPLTRDDVYDYYDNYIPDPQLAYHIEASCDFDAATRQLLRQISTEYRAAYYKDTDPDLLYGMQYVFKELADEWPFSDPRDAPVLLSLTGPLARITERANIGHIKPATAIRKTIAERRKELEAWAAHRDTLDPQQRKAVADYLARLPGPAAAETARTEDENWER